MKPCTEGKRHKWVHTHNISTVHQTLRTTRFSLRGVYRCACGEKKIGAPAHGA